MNKNSEGDLKISEETLELDFGKSDSNLSDGTILIRVHGNGKTESNIDWKIWKRYLGQNTEDLEAYLSTFNEFSNVEVEFWPSF